MRLRTLAIDWSGAASGAESKIWLAEAAEGDLVRLECGRSRGGVAEHLIAEAARTPELAVGLDFAFSLPAWFLEERGLLDGPALWELVADEGESWLAACEPPFWGRPGRGRPSLPDDLRRTDREVPAVGGIRPKSVFQIGGAGAVGTGSLRGMPILKQLRDAGFQVWPFDAPGRPLVVEIYPRLLTGVVNKGNEGARASYLAVRFPALSGEILERAASSEDAFDAAVSALVMDAAREDLARLTLVADAQHRREGQIWAPAGGVPPSTAEVGRRGGSGHEVAPDAEEWRALVRTMLPPPVHEDGSNTFIGGDPGEVVVHLALHAITVSRFGVRWNGQVPEPAHHEVARFDPRTATPRAVARAVVRARSARLGTYRWCTHCHETLPPEWMHGAVLSEIAREVRAAANSLSRADQTLSQAGALPPELRAEMATDPQYGRPEERQDWFIEPLLTVNEVASILRLSTRAVRRLPIRTISIGGGGAVPAVGDPGFLQKQESKVRAW